MSAKIKKAIGEENYANYATGKLLRRLIQRGVHRKLGPSEFHTLLILATLARPLITFLKCTDEVIPEVAKLTGFRQLSINKIVCRLIEKGEIMVRDKEWLIHLGEGEEL